MTVRNAQGSRTCHTTVYYNPKPKNGWDVYLTSKDPVFRRTDIPGGFDNSGGYFPFMAIQWLSGGYFVVSGEGNSTCCGSIAKLKPDVHESGGMYGFDENGKFLGVRNVVYDTSGERLACFEGGGCFVGYLIHPTGTNTFVRELTSNGPGVDRSPIHYNLTPSGFSMLSRLFFNLFSWFNYSDFFGDPNPPIPSMFTHLAVADGKIFGVGFRCYHSNFPPLGPGLPPVDKQCESALEIYDLNFNFLGKYSYPISYKPSSPNKGVRTGPTIIPLVGIGDYFLGIEGEKNAYIQLDDGASGEFIINKGKGLSLNVYKSPTLDEISNQSPIQKIQTIENPEKATIATVTFAFDSSDKNRLALMWYISPSKKIVEIYEARDNGLERTNHYELKNNGVFVETKILRTQAGFAISGDYIAYAYCSDSNFNITNPVAQNESCRLVVENMKTGKELAVEPIPRVSQFIIDSHFPTAQRPVAISMSPNGKIMVAARGHDDWGSLFLYQIKDFDPQLPVQPPQPPPVPSGTGDTSKNYFFGCKIPSNQISEDGYTSLLEFNRCVLQNIATYKW